MSHGAHWERIYLARRPDHLSWFQEEARLSRRLIEHAAPDRAARIIDVGAGTSPLVDDLLAAGYHRLTVVEISDTALSIARERLGSAADPVSWLRADILEAALPPQEFDIWHDRAVFHFLIEAVDRARYLDQVRRSLRPGGYLLVATFAADGPTHCSGLEVARYSSASLHAAFGAGFHLVESHRELHVTPTGATQAFTYCLCRLEGETPPPD